MCWRRKPPEVVNKNRMILQYGINNYPGTGSDLNGCLNDLTDFGKLMNWPLTTFRDSEVTKTTFRDTVRNYILGMQPDEELIIQYSGHGTRVKDTSGDEEDGYDEALYLYGYDGVFIDDEFNEIMKLIPVGAKVIVILDSCFSGTATRNIGRYRKSKYVLTDPVLEKAKRVVKSSQLNHIVISGCQSHQTSSDAYINGRYNGALTRALIENYGHKTYKQWVDDCIFWLHSRGFDQVPTLEGPEGMIKSYIDA